jgi:hypothetical protein
MAFGLNLTGIKEVENALKTMDKQDETSAGK